LERLEKGLLMKRINIIEYLSGNDKWFLGGGDAVIWTPPFPQYLETMGLWDIGSYYNHDYGNVFAVTILDDDGKEIRFQQKRRVWNPSYLECEYVSVKTGAYYITVRERKMVLPNDIFTSEIEISNPHKISRKLNVIFWTMRMYSDEKTPGNVHTVSADKDKICFNSIFKITTGPEIHASTAMGMDRPADSYLVQLSQTGQFQPVWKFTPFYDRFDKNGLQNEINIEGVTNKGVLYQGMHAVVNLPANRTKKIRFCVSVAKTMEKAIEHLKESTSSKYNPLKETKENWQKWFDSVPYFECSDEYLQKYYWYRWYGLRLMTTFGGIAEQPYPSINEGISYFRGPISYSAWCHILETRWLSNPSLAQGCFQNFVSRQRQNGSYPGTILHHAGVGWDFFHANWGPAILGVDLIHPDDIFLKSIRESLVRYITYMDGERDREASGLYDVIDQFETGQEFMSRYVAVNPEADQGIGEERFRLKGIDATVAVYNVKRLLAHIGRRLGNDEDAHKWDAESEKIKTALLDKMWNPETEMFSDVMPDGFRRTNIKSLVCFQPYWSDIVDKRHLDGFKKHLFSPDEFWTNYPAASTSIDDKYYHPDGLWKMKRHNCPWNGRVWPMQNSFVAEALGTMADRYDESLRPRLTEFIRKFIRMMFHDGDIEKPNCYEHYNPVNGRPCIYRGINDYQHSTVVDLIIKYVAGFFPQRDGTYKVQSMGKEFKRIVLLGIPFSGRKIDIVVENGKTKVKEHGKKKKMR
jgi:hypothetical protein